MQFKSQSGNVLFLILIAVALFAALSYAVTSSTRSGGGSAEKETLQLTASEIFSFYTGVRTSITRMILAGTSPEQINFIRNDTTPEGLFSPNGGASIYASVPQGIGSSAWGFAGLQSATAGLYVENIGTNTDISGREIIGGLSNIPLALCEIINRRLGLGTPPATNSPTGNPFTASYSVGNNVIDAYPGQAQGCFDADGGSGVYVYYITLLEN